MKITDSKQMDQFIKAIRSKPATDSFSRDILAPQLDHFEQMQHFEKAIDKILSQKRIEIQENLAFSNQSIETTLRFFLDSKITANDAGEKIFALNMFGRLILKEEEENSKVEFFQNYKNNNLFEKNLVKQFYFPDFVRELIVDFPDSSLSPAQYLISPEKLKKSNLKNFEKTGFTIVRSLPQEVDHNGLQCKVTFVLEGASLELKSALAEFMGRPHATRREILDKIWDHITHNKLIEKSTVSIDGTLRKIFEIKSSDIQTIQIDEISLKVKQMVGETTKYEFNYVIREENDKNSNLKAWDLALTLPLEEVSDCMAFFVQKLIFTEEEKDKFLKDEQSNEVNPIIKTNERTNLINESIIRRFQKFEKHLTKRDSFAKLRIDVSRYLDSFLVDQKHLLSSVKAYSSNILSKRNWNDEQEYTELLVNNYEPILEKETASYLKIRGLLGPK
jgi:hypothetical protein